MAKKDEQKAKPSENGHNKVQGFVFGINLEGSKEVVLEGIKSFTAAMTAGGAATFAAPPRKSAALTSGSKSTTATTIDAEEPEATEVAEVSEEEITTPDIEEEETNGNGNGSTPRRRIPPTPKLVSDLDITADPMPFKTFLEQKTPRKSQDRMAVVATWLKKHKGYDEIGRDHYYTVYQQMGGSGDWKCLNNWDVLIRQLAKRKGWFEKGTSEATFKVSIVATNYVDAMTPTGA
jgi:hypothetical protein